MRGGNRGFGLAPSVHIQIRPDEGLDDETLDRLTRRLRAELAEVEGVDSSALAGQDQTLEGAKAGDPVTLGAIVVTLGASGGVFAGLIGAVRDWLGRTTGRHRISVTIDGDTIELEQATLDQQQELLDAFVLRHRQH
jgi:Effector Associated Constant Component 1